MNDHCVINQHADRSSVPLHFQPDGALTCPLCGARARSCGDIAGYQEPERFGIAACSTCDTAFSLSSGRNRNQIYESIYEQARMLRGYEKYYRRAKKVRVAADPLGYLAGSEDTYWAIATYLSGRSDSRDLNIAEIGSGIGYLTFALHRSGYKVRGIDLSESAVRQARQTFGDYYDCLDVMKVPDAYSTKFDVVIMTEVIEHVDDPTALLEGIGRILTDQGVIVVTTPNKSYHPPSSVWDTELPPIHMWWFSESSLRFVARAAGYDFALLDFSEYNLTHYCPPPKGPIASAQQSMLDQTGKLKPEFRIEGWSFAVKCFLVDTGIFAFVRSLQARIATLVVGRYRRRLTLCAIFSRPPVNAA